jgi:hypothetical protein
MQPGYIDRLYLYKVIISDELNFALQMIAGQQLIRGSRHKQNTQFGKIAQNPSGNPG